jgi:aldehyde:ferredoxin oxidoreductase
MVTGKYFGYAGKILKVDLSSLSYVIEDTPLDLIVNFMGGKGFGAKILYDELKPGCGSLSEDNILVVATGPLTGTLMPASGHITLCTKSPLTGIWLDSHSAGFLGPELKMAGYDAIIIKGKAKKPTILVIKNDKISFEDGKDLWGKYTFESQELLRQKYGRDCQFMCIGPAGERKARFANIVSGGRGFGRGGSGAVMGSKNLKAIVVKGTNGINISDLDGFMRMCKEAYNELAISPDTGGGRPKYGTNSIYSFMIEAGAHPVKNFQTGVFEEVKECNEDVLDRKYYKRNIACFSCPINCSKASRVDNGKYKGKFTEGPEYENMWSLGAQCGNSNIGAIIYAEHLCDEYGVDAISAGNVIGFTMECFEKGILSEKQIGFRANFGNDEAIIKFIEMMGKGEGIGELMSQGVRQMAKELGKGTEKFAMHVKGMEIPAYDPRGAFGMGLAYATSDRGACHLRAWTIGAEILDTQDRMDPFATEFKAELVKNQQDFYAVIQSAVVCLFLNFGLSQRHITRSLQTLTGIKEWKTTEDILKIGERIYNLTRLFSMREGISRKDDTLPERLLKEPVSEGPTKGVVVDLDTMLKEYYLVRHWDEEGRPTKEKLAELGLDRWGLGK